MVETPERAVVVRAPTARDVLVERAFDVFTIRDGVPDTVAVRAVTPRDTVVRVGTPDVVERRVVTLDVVPAPMARDVVRPDVVRGAAAGPTGTLARGAPDVPSVLPDVSVTSVSSSDIPSDISSASVYSMTSS